MKAYELRDFLAATGVSGQTVRRWVDAEILLPRIHRSEHSGDRHLWSDDDVELAKLLWRIHEAGWSNDILKVVSDQLRLSPWLMHGWDLLVMRGGEVIMANYEVLPAIFRDPKGSGVAMVARLR